MTMLPSYWLGKAVEAAETDTESFALAKNVPHTKGAETKCNPGTQ